MKKYFLLLFLGFTGSLNAQILLNLPKATQLEDKWCAVACSQSVLRYFGPYIPQCEIMEFVRKESLSYGFVCCCDDASQGCNAGINLYGAKKNSVQYILSYCGEINSIGVVGWLWPYEVSAYIRNNRPLIINLQNKYYYNLHGVVIRGIDDKYKIYYMDPIPGNYGGFQQIPYNQLVSGLGIEFYWEDTLVIGDFLYPQHCFDCEPNGDETGTDCGGSCDPCNVSPPPPQPTSNCTNCKKEFGVEDEIDCGGPCPSCEDVPDERIIKTAYYGYNTRVMALNKITAGNGTYQVVVGKSAEVSFITEKSGNIVLLPGFNAEKGCSFTTHRWENLSEFSRICPDNLCSTAKISVNSTHYSPPHPDVFTLWLYDLLYAVKIEYEIYDIQGKFIYRRAFNIMRNGDFVLWDCQNGAINTQGTVTYNILYTIYYC